jgi:hypothetical protein
MADSGVTARKPFHQHSDADRGGLGKDCLSRSHVAKGIFRDSARIPLSNKNNSIRIVKLGA